MTTTISVRWSRLISTMKSQHWLINCDKWAVLVAYMIRLIGWNGSSNFSVTSYKWNHIIFVLLCLAYFTKHNVFKVHPCCSVQFSSSVVSDYLIPHELQHARPPCPSPTPGVNPNPYPCPLSWWCHPTISSSVVPFSSCPQSFPASGSFLMSQLFAWGGQSIGVSVTYIKISFFYGWISVFK